MLRLDPSLADAVVTQTTRECQINHQWLYEDKAFHKVAFPRSMSFAHITRTLRDSLSAAQALSEFRRKNKERAMARQARREQRKLAEQRRAAAIDIYAPVPQPMHSAPKVHPKPALPQPLGNAAPVATHTTASSNSAALQFLATLAAR